MFTDLTQVPPTFKTIVHKQRRQVLQRKALKCGVLVAGVTCIVAQVALGWSPYTTLGCICLTVAALGCYIKISKCTDLEVMPSKLLLHMRVFAKASSPSGRYFQRVRNQNRQFVMGEYRMLEKEFKRVSYMREQDLKSGNKRLFPPLPATIGRNASTTDTHSLQSSQEFVACHPTRD